MKMEKASMPSSLVRGSQEAFMHIIMFLFTTKRIRGSKQAGGATWICGLLL
jgi:hypothetical protein